MEMDFEIILRFALAALWGGIVGAEREYRSKSAGFRTMILISVGACFFTYMSVLIGHDTSADRIASNIVTGIGFLGAGVIFRGKNHLTGITTAATIWAVAAIGMGIGAGYYFASACACVLICFVLAVLPYIEKVIDRMNQTKIYTICYPNSSEGDIKFENLFASYSLKYSVANKKKKDELITTTWNVQGKAKNHELFSQNIMNDALIHSFQF